MPVLIDGNNLMHALPDGLRSREAVRKMALDVVRQERTSMTLVFDGPPPAGTPPRERLGRLTVVYSGGSSADDIIMRLLPQGPAARGWTVVTDDRELTSRARNAGAGTSSPNAWRAKLMRSLEPAEKPGHPLSRAEINRWEQYFRSGRNG